jgi:UDP-2,3-diacylglucosamine pyrophosphatase LpxH
MILITDAHVSVAKGNQTLFFEMLESLEKNRHDLIFLGDIFDLWIALPSYEGQIHRDFIAWCRRQKNHRTIGYVEGNHEYYLADERGSDFTWCSENVWQEADAGLFFTHGDQVNRKDKNYLAFRTLAKNKLSKFIIRWLPFGPKMTKSIKRGLKKTNARFRMQLPEAQIEKFAMAKFDEDVHTIFMGHFHLDYRYQNPDGKNLHVLPDWFSTQKVTIYQQDSKEVLSIHWKNVGV